MCTVATRVSSVSAVIDLRQLISDGMRSRHDALVCGQLSDEGRCIDAVGTSKLFAERFEFLSGAGHEYEVLSLFGVAVGILRADPGACSSDDDEWT